ncbi:MAG: hypothetical protein HC916_08450 [Coleofasciculaceae cyanobacterium SM2_1_6]|nr:hypothetical protein [Coleofasciculaceae cyanobacterium SM2_1_6]
MGNPNNSPPKNSAVAYFPDSLQQSYQPPVRTTQSQASQTYKNLQIGLTGCEPII